VMPIASANDVGVVGEVGDKDLFLHNSPKPSRCPLGPSLQIWLQTRTIKVNPKQAIHHTSSFQGFLLLPLPTTSCHLQNRMQSHSDQWRSFPGSPKSVRVGRGTSNGKSTPRRRSRSRRSSSDMSFPMFVDLQSECVMY